MPSIERLSSFLFIVSSLVAIFAGAFPLYPGSEPLIITVLIFTGIFIGLVNITTDQQMHFLLGSSAFLIAAFILEPTLSGYALISSIGTMIRYFIIFTATATFVVSFGWILNLGSTIEEEKQQTSQRITWWDNIVVISVAIAILIFVLSIFYDVTRYEKIIKVLDLEVMTVFIIDLFVLYRKAGSLPEFLKRDYTDIIAAIPFSLILSFTFASAFNLVKVLRVIRLTRILRLSRAGKATKFFSRESGFTRLFTEKKRANPPKRKA